jgi:GNAT superfamily N-acetyltransferase
MAGASARNVRLAEPGDAATVTELVRRAYEHYVDRIGRKPIPMTTDYAAAIAAASVWVLVIEERLVGVLVLQPEDDHLLVDNLAVDPQYQGRGAGGHLLAFAEQHAADVGLPELRLYTHEKMTENRAFYPRRGFTEGGREQLSGHVRVLFRKPVPPRPTPVRRT